jgi:hypothetical protein
LEVVVGLTVKTRRLMDRTIPIGEIRTIDKAQNEPYGLEV